MRKLRLAVGALIAAVLAAGFPTAPAGAITQSQVDEACANSRQAYETYQAARSDFEAAAVALEDANNELDEAEHQEQRIRSIYQGRQDEQTRLQTRVEETATELYMQAAAGPSLGIMTISSPGDALTALELHGVADESQAVVVTIEVRQNKIDQVGLGAT